MLDYALSSMQHGDHFCLFYRSVEEQRRVVVPFLAAGLRRGERCVFLGESRSVAWVSQGLAQSGIEVDVELERGALVLESGHGHLVDGRFDPDAMVTFLEQIVDETVASGFTGWRATGDSHWEMGEHPDYPALERYEGLLDRFFHNRPMVGMCQHDLRRMPAEVLPNLLASHRKLILDGALSDSHCYRQPMADVETFLARRPRVDAELNQPARHLELMLSAIDEAVFAHDHEGHLIYANRAGRKLLAVPAYSAVFREIVGPPSRDIEFHAEDGRALTPERLPWRIAMRERRPSEKFIRCPDPWLSRDRWWLAKAMPLFEGADCFDYCVTVIEDVTERRELTASNQRLELQIAETERLNLHVSQQQVLFREVHHRIKNSLQLLTNLVAVQAMRCHDQGGAEIFDDLQNRINAISLVHDLLYRQGKEATVDLAAYLRSVVDMVATSVGADERGVKITVSALPGSVGMDTAMPVGLIVNEILTNALKHAFPDGRTGEIAVTLRPDGNLWRLEIADDGIGIDRGRPSDSGVGTGLIGALVSNIHGRLNVQAAGGTEVSLSFPHRD